VSGRRALRWLAAAFVLLGVLLIVAILEAGHFLSAPAQSPVKADLIAALGGDNGARADRMLQLYRAGYANKLLLTGPETSNPKLRAVHQSWRARYLVEEGVPEGALLFDRRSKNSYEEALNTLELMRAMKLDRVIVVSDLPHMRRVDWTWRRVFEGSGKAYTLVASVQPEWDAARWWRSSLGAQFVFGEYIKLAYYLIQY
jgi:uncharacterized SAM-binding protein YcdF (DUF218 family)